MKRFTLIWFTFDQGMDCCKHLRKLQHIWCSASKQCSASVSWCSTWIAVSLVPEGANWANQLGCSFLEKFD